MDNKETGRQTSGNGSDVDDQADSQFNQKGHLKDRLDAISASVRLHFELITEVKKESARYLKTKSEEKRSKELKQNKKTNIDIYSSPSISDETVSENVENEAFSETESESQSSTDDEADDYFENQLSESQNTVSPDQMQSNFTHNFESIWYVETARLVKAKEANVKALHSTPNNFNALWNKVRLLIASSNDETKDVGDKEAEEILDHLEQIVSKNRRDLMIAKAEIAFMYQHYELTAQPYVKSAQMLEEVLSGLDTPTEGETYGEISQNLVVFWKYRLAISYSFLSEADDDLLLEFGYTYISLLFKLNDLHKPIISSEYLNDELKARHWLRVGNVLKDCMQREPNRHDLDGIFKGLSPQLCFRTGYALDQNNLELLFNLAREKRVHSSTDAELKEAISQLELCTENDDLKSVAFHHMGIANRTLWIRNESIDFVAAAERFHRMECPKSNAPSACLVIRAPKTPIGQEDLPRPYKKAPIKSLRCVVNPLAKDPQNIYLAEAHRCFEEANRAKPQCLYLLECAKTAVSMGNLEKAAEYFSEAYKLPLFGVGVNLNEGLGLIEHQKMIECKEYDGDSAKKAKVYYREAIRYGVFFPRKPAVAFHYLLRVLYLQLMNCHTIFDSEVMILQNEYFLLYMAIQQAESNEDILKVIANDDNKVALMWKLIMLFDQRDLESDGPAALAYLTILIVTGKFTANIADTNLTALEKQDMLLESTIRTAMENFVRARYLPVTYKWLCRFQDGGAEVKYKSTIAILTDRKSKELKSLIDILLDQLRSNKRVIIVNDLEAEELCSSSPPMDRLVANIGQMASVIVLTTDATTDLDKQNMSLILDAMDNNPSHNRQRICQVMMGQKNKCSFSPRLRVCCFPPVNEEDVDDKKTQVDRACTLLRLLFKR